MENTEYLNWDKSYQNEDGDTALHVAIATDADIEILKSIFEKGVDINVANNDGKTPFECIKHGSWQTAINILKLEKDYDMRDEVKDTFLHVLMDRVGDSLWGVRRTLDGKDEFGQFEQELMIGKFWDHILENLTEFEIHLNTQNTFGCTPLHIAADYWPSMKSLEILLSHFKDVNPFICDENGENFLHRYFLRHRGIYECAVGLQDKMLKGKLRYLPKNMLVKLLNSQNTDRNTPLHILIKLGEGKAVNDFEDILEAGADANIRDWIGDTALHSIFKKYINQLEEETEVDDQDLDEQIDELIDEVIQCLVRHGADVNAVNHRGESPIFLAKNQQHIKSLVSLGADVNVRNKLQQTPLLYFVSKEKVNLNTLEDLLEHDADVNAADVHGNTALHYIAWHGYHKDFIPVLKKYEVKSVKDKIGQLPCNVAYTQGHKTIFDELCECKKDSHKDQEHFNLTNEVINLTELVKTPNDLLDKFEHIRNFRAHQMSKILSLPGIGAVNFEGEAAEIKAVTKAIVENICENLNEKNEFWKCRIKQSGSVGEDTKVKSPNEFDFVIILEKLGEICVVDEERSKQDRGYAYLKLKEEYATADYQKYFNEENYLDAAEVRNELTDILDELYTTEGPFQHPNISFVVGNNKAVISPTFNFTFYWKGCLFKNILVDIDLVPACQIKGWWPEDSNIDGLEGDTTTLKDQGAVLLLQTELKLGDKPQCKLRISAMTAEKEHMLNLPQVARDAYKVSKILCDGRLCPDLHLKADIPIKKLLTSYMLKNTLFHVMNDIKVDTEQEKTNEPNDKKIPRFHENIELQHIVKNVFHKLMKFAKDESLPSFVLPWQNVFTFNSKVFPNHNHYFCAFRSCFIKIILTMLGERQDFSDIDVESCSLAVRDRSETEDIDNDEYEVEDEVEDMERLTDDSSDEYKWQPYTLL